MLKKCSRNGFQFTLLSNSGSSAVVAKEVVRQTGSILCTSDGTWFNVRQVSYINQSQHVILPTMRCCIATSDLSSCALSTCAPFYEGSSV